MTKSLILTLNPQMNVNTFDSGDKEVNDFLYSNGIQEQENKITKIYVITFDNRIIAYSALFCTHFRLSLPEQPTPFRVSGLFIGQLGVDKEFQGKGLAKLLIEHSIALANQISEKVGCRIVFLEALDNKVDFYYKLHFRVIEKRKNRNKMYLDLLN